MLLSEIVKSERRGKSLEITTPALRYKMINVGRRQIASVFFYAYRRVVSVALTEKQQRFVEEYLVDLNATEAAKRAGYSEKTAYSIGFENLRKPEIQEEIQAMREEQAKRTGVTADRVIQEYARIAFFDPRRLFQDDGKPKDISTLDDETAAALVGMDVAEEYEGAGEDREFVGYTKKYKVADKLRALEALGKHLGIFDGRGGQNAGHENNLLEAIGQFGEVDTDDLPEAE